MGAQLCQGQPLFLVAGLLLSLLTPALSPAPVTSEDVALLGEVSETIRCFSRSFEDLTCFWDEEAERGNHTYRFYYTYNGETAKECALALQRRSGGGSRYVCIFPSSHEVRLFTQLCLRVLDTRSNQTKYSREVAVETVGLVAPPVNITATWAGAAGALQVSWEPPATEYTELFIYEILYCIVGSMEPPCWKQVHSTRACVLHTLQPGAKYHIRIRTKPDGLSLDGFWGPWSQAVAAEIPRSSGEIGLRCFTPDLQWVRCEWTWDPADSNSSHSLFYRSQGSSDASRGQAWQHCQEHSVGPQSTHSCMFQPRNDSDIFTLVNVSRGHLEPVLSYFGEPFRMHQAVLTRPPRILQANISSGQLRLQWDPPQEELAEYMVYQVRYSVKNSMDWKVLQIQHAATSETLDLRAGPGYLLQVRAKPNAQQLQGFWSAWSETIVVEGPSGAGSKDTGEPDAFTAPFSVPGWIILSLTITLVFFVGLLGLRCSFPSVYSSVKRKLWPPAPDLHRVLGTFLTDGSKQQQANTSFYNKPLEDVILPCLLEVLSERKGAETPPEPTLLKTAGPGSDIPEGPEDPETSNLSSPHQDYMVLHPSSPTGSRYENEYLDSRGEGDDSYLRGLAVLLLHVPDAHSELRQDRAEIQYNPLVPSSLQAEDIPLGGPVDSEEEDWDCPCSGKQSMSTTDISNQSYLLMSSWEQQPFL
ncbi:thrombopoietin receptor isoform X1 [Lepidochelys kempii]|uniref:thrombopoietin receptor isoform X1 n=1 Tax=Lepidochelys kempii TaxID=8472 RepID=UPI003C6FFBAB